MAAPFRSARKPRPKAVNGVDRATADFGSRYFTGSGQSFEVRQADAEGGGGLPRTKRDHELFFMGIQCVHCHAAFLASEGCEFSWEPLITSEAAGAVGGGSGLGLQPALDGLPWPTSQAANLDRLWHLAPIGEAADMLG
jgi:hypothetical protein